MSTITVVGALIVNALAAPARVLAARRTGTHAGFWEFPGGKVESGESPQAALAREVREELGVRVEVLDELDADSNGWRISDTLVLRLFVAKVGEGTPKPGTSHDQIRWVGPEEIDSLEWLPSDRSALPALKKKLGW